MTNVLGKRTIDGLVKLNTNITAVGPTQITSNATSNQSITYPNASGTVALTNQVVDLTNNQSISGTKTFNNQVIVSNGNVSTPAIQVGSTTGQGFYAAAGTIYVTIGGSVVGWFSTTQNLMQNLQIGPTASIFSKVLTDTVSITLTALVNQGVATKAVTFPTSFSTTPTVILSCTNGNTYSGGVWSAGSITTTGFTLYCCNAAGTVSATSTVQYLAFTYS